MVDRRADTEFRPGLPGWRNYLQLALLRLTLLAAFVILGVIVSGVVSRAEAEANASQETGRIGKACSSSARLLGELTMAGALNPHPACLAAEDLADPARRITAPTRQSISVEDAAAPSLVDQVDVAVDTSIEVLTTIAPRTVESESTGVNPAAIHPVTSEDVLTSQGAQHRRSPSDVPAWGGRTVPQQADDALSWAGHGPSAPDFPAGPLVPPAGTNSASVPSGGGSMLSATLTTEPSYGDMFLADVAPPGRLSAIHLLAADPPVSPD